MGVASQEGPGFRPFFYACDPDKTVMGIGLAANLTYTGTTLANLIPSDDGGTLWISDR